MAVFRESRREKEYKEQQKKASNPEKKGNKGKKNGNNAFWYFNFPSE